MAFVQRNNPTFNREIAMQFEKQGRIYGIRGDVALCQSIKETGWFKYIGSAVTPDQNNFCGMGVTSLGVKGNSFTTIELGVKAQIQHLFAYACKDILPVGELIVDPRFGYVARGIAPNWVDLSNRWAMTATYGQDILKLYDDLYNFAKGEIGFAASYISPRKQYKVQVGAYSVKSNADVMAERLRAANFANVFVTPMGTDKLFYVQNGPYADSKDADAALANVKKAGFAGAFIKVE
ncbi:MAG: glucosaminidase domain-containing protein [Oscillospiraceae bacterium]|nr:glucosaminidase domain-containing protein [Oscillospiraceae bacterium]